MRFGSSHEFLTVREITITVIRVKKTRNCFI